MRAACVAGLLAALGGGVAAPPAAAGDVLLTFDTEFENDAEAIVELGLTVDATYFWTGSYARQHPQLLQRLASQGHTIGAHSFFHDDLTLLDPEQLRADIDLNKAAVESISGVPVTAFRAPFLKFNDAVMAEVQRQGFLIDSSEEAAWPRNPRLPVLGVSVFENLLVSDFDIFDGLGLDDATALDFLIRAYAEHDKRGQPFVMLLHPRIIARHASVIRDFIAHVETGGGRFLTFADYIDTVTRSLGARQTGIWAEVGPSFDVAAVLAQAKARAATDVYLSLPHLLDLPQGPTLAALAVRKVQAQGIRLHLAFPVMHNPELAAARPGTRMDDDWGRPSRDWISPSHPQARALLIARAHDLVASLGVDGVLLCGLGYPGLAWDFSPAARQHFTAQSAVSEVAPGDILLLHYLPWTQWRSRETALLVAEIAAAARSSKAEVTISVSLPAAAATDFRMQELTGQDFRRIGGVVDAIILSRSLATDRDGASLARGLLATRAQAGAVAILSEVDVADDAGINLADYLAGSAQPTLPTLLALSSGSVADLRARHTHGNLTIWPALTLPLDP
ncbi:polysaccharide deacetylase family protein [Tabrizicola sp.]|uniref:polysaccharide deacetylase family protein n=1 Tax=Tabrizicola sp. TaxID=2005166 RepID=UPI00273550AF|nr:polysaccharide deacetylase family protein [Tabrizicola sp.]